ncbi:MAG: DJ-1/PfpI family protein [Eubacterium sp.]|nr:DJ-1/PfpI family protein [Eubacterium sp.]
MSKIAVFFADGCEEIEGLTVVDMLRRAEQEVVSVSVTGSREIHGSHQITFFADTTFEEAGMDAFDGVVLPGGAVGTANLGAHEGVVAVIKKFAEEGKLVAAICAAPSVLGANGILQGRRAACHPGWEEKMVGAEPVFENAVTDGNIITSRGMGTSIDFSLAILAKLADEDVISKVKKGIVY